MLDDNEKYWAKMVLMARDGNTEATSTIRHNIEDMPMEIYEWYTLCMNLDIRVGSPEEKRYAELSDKYETPEVLAYQVM